MNNTEIYTQEDHLLSDYEDYDYEIYEKFGYSKDKKRSNKYDEYYYEYPY